jgi:hypothetical protein
VSLAEQMAADAGASAVPQQPPQSLSASMAQDVGASLSSQMARDATAANDEAAPKKPPAAAPVEPASKSAFGGGGWEGFAKLATGAAANVYGGFKGAGMLATGSSLDDAVNAIHAAQNDYTYEPKTQEGKDVAAILSKPGQWIGAAAGKIGEAVQEAGSPEHPFYLEGQEVTVPSSVRAGLATAADVGTQFAGPVAAMRALGRVLPKGVPSGGPPVPEGAAGLVQPSEGAAGAAAAKPVAPVFEQPAEPIPGAQPATPPAAAADVAARKAVLNRIGLPQARESAVNADAGAASTDFQQAKLDSPDGKAMQAQLGMERQALQNHAEGIVRDTGGTVGMDETARILKGNTILAPLDALGEWFNTQTKALYTAARAKAGDTPVAMDNLKALAGDESNFLGTTEGEALYKGLQARMGKLGVGDEATVGNAENLRQWLNDNWTPRTSRFVGQLKNAIDDDVTSSAGSDVFQQARAMRALRARTLEDPNGIAKLIDANGPGGINRAVPVEKIPDMLTTLPSAQFTHVTNVLKNLPPEIQPLGDAALSEIKAHMANRVADAGGKTATQWNAKGVATELARNSSRYQQVFSPQEISALQDLNQAGNILHVNASYPGALVQGANLIQRGAMKVIPATGAAAGGLAGGLFGFPGTGAAAGAAGGEALAQSLAARSALRSVRSRIVPTTP